MYSTPKRKIRRAFTLVELLTVIGIITLLLSILMPALGKTRQAGRTIVCQANLHSIGQGFRLYLNNSNDIMPDVAYLPSAKLNELPKIVDVLSPYLDNPKVFQCPADTEKKYYLTEGSSYAYMTQLAGKRVTSSFLAQRYGLTETKVPIMHDYETFHNDKGQTGAMNYLFGDGHVGPDIEQ